MEEFSSGEDQNFDPSRSASALTGLFCPGEAVEGRGHTSGWLSHSPGGPSDAWGLLPAAAPGLVSVVLPAHHMKVGDLLDQRDVHSVACVCAGAMFVMFKPFAEKQVDETQSR